MAAKEDSTSSRSDLKPDGSWGEPENLGPPFNTSRDERFITLPAAGDIVYFRFGAAKPTWERGTA